jgi:hypothetical protein
MATSCEIELRVHHDHLIHRVENEERHCCEYIPLLQIYGILITIRSWPEETPQSVEKELEEFLATCIT